MLWRQRPELEIVIRMQNQIAAEAGGGAGYDSVSTFPAGTGGSGIVIIRNAR